MSTCHFFLGSEHTRTRIIPGINDQMVKEMSCPAPFNPGEVKWFPKDSENPYEGPRYENFMQHQKRARERRIR